MTSLDLALTDDRTTSHAHGPGLVAVLKRLAVSLGVAVVVPAVLFYVTLTTFGLTPAILTALVWSYGAIGWRRLTHRPMSGLLALTVRNTHAWQPSPRATPSSTSCSPW